MEFPEELIDGAGWQGEGAVAVGAGDVDANGTAFDVEDGGAGLVGLDDLIRVEGEGEVEAALAEFAAFFREAFESVVPHAGLIEKSAAFGRRANAEDR